MLFFFFLVFLFTHQVIFGGKNLLVMGFFFNDKFVKTRSTLVATSSPSFTVHQYSKAPKEGKHKTFLLTRSRLPSQIPSDITYPLWLVHCLFLLSRNLLSNTSCVSSSVKFGPVPKASTVRNTSSLLFIDYCFVCFFLPTEREIPHPSRRVIPRRRLKERSRDAQVRAWSVPL